jgi:hypothetical protein
MAADRRVVAARVAGLLLAAVPGVGLGAATLWQAASEGAAASQNQHIHLGLGLALLVLFCECAVAISRAGTVAGALLSGAAGFVDCVAAAVAVELLGPFALLALVVVVAVWAIRIALTRPMAREGARTPSSA